MNQKYMIYMYLLKARTFIALLLVIAFFSVMVPNFLHRGNPLVSNAPATIPQIPATAPTDRSMPPVRITNI
jgi:erythritol transport system permease protein